MFLNIDYCRSVRKRLHLKEDWFNLSFQFSSSEWLDDFSDEDIGDGLDTEDDELADKQKLFVVGCRPKIRGQYEVPSLDETYEVNIPSTFNIIS